MGTGKTGERLLGVWASQANMTFNTSVEEDSKGWDSFLEFQTGRDSNTPRDKDFNHIKCFIQVKTTKNNKVTDDILLSNWDSMIKNPLPFFILGITLDEQENPKKIFLTHIDEKWIGKVIKRLRKIEDSDKLNKQTLQYSAADSDRLLEISGNAIRSKIIEYINGTTQEYVKLKNGWLETIGYDESRSRVSLNVIGTKDEIIDFSIGLKKDIEVSNCEIKDDIRFGIPGKEEFFDSGLIEIHPAGIDVKVKFSNNYFSIISNGKLFDPSTVLGKVPHQIAKVRIVTKFYDLILGSGREFSINIKGDLSEIEKEIKTLLDYAHFVLILYGIQENAAFEIEVNEIKLSVPVSEELGKSVKHVISDDILNLAKMIDELNFILNNLNITPPETLDIDELFPYRNFITNIKIVLDVRFYGKLIMRAKYNEEGKGTDNSVLVLIGDKVALPRVLFFKLADRYIIVNAIYYGVFTEDSNGYRQYKMEPRFESHEIIKEISDSIIEEKTAILSNNIETGYFNLLQEHEF